MADCAVLYLERWCNKPYFARTFLSSMHRNPAGADYDYVHVLKGFAPGTESEALKEYKENIRPDTIVFHVSDEKTAHGAMLEAIKTLPHKKILVFLSWSRILAPHWLKSYLNAFNTVENCGLVGATSGWERRNYKDLSEPFPNIGIRVNAFMIDRQMYVDMAEGRFDQRRDENDFEAGIDGLTKKIMRQGLKAVIVDRNGKVWYPEDWPQSKTFRAGFQEGLLVADNRTYDYAVAKQKRRKWLAKLNWGDAAEVPRTSYLRRISAYLDWHYRGR